MVLASLSGYVTTMGYSLESQVWLPSVAIENGVFFNMAITLFILSLAISLMRQDILVLPLLKCGPKLKASERSSVVEWPNI